MSVLVEDFYPNGDFEEDVPPSVLDSFLKDLSGKLEAFRENFVKLLEEQAKYVQSQFVTKVVPVGRLAALHSVRERMRSAFKAPLACILDPNTDVALGGLRWKDPSNVKHLRPQNVVLTHTGAEPHEEKTEQTQLIVSGTPIEETGTHSHTCTSQISCGTSFRQNACHEHDCAPTNQSLLPTNIAESQNGVFKRIPVIIMDQPVENDSKNQKPDLCDEAEFVVYTEPLNHFVCTADISILFVLTHDDLQHTQTPTFREFKKKEKFTFNLRMCPEDTLSVQICHGSKTKLNCNVSVSDLDAGIDLHSTDNPNVPFVRLSGRL
ncbi:hypothetical protein GEMRC1_006584 [Eukaryota sp. GEM-RC1]